MLLIIDIYIIFLRRRISVSVARIYPSEFADTKNADIKSLSFKSLTFVSCFG